MATRVRYSIIGTTTLAAVLMYLDRNCIAEIAKLDEFNSDLDISDRRKGWILGSFFLAYAIAQVPAGWLSDRFGARKMLPIYIIFWSACTVLTGLASGFALFIAARFCCGLAQAGGYPTSGSLIKRWMPLGARATASGIVSVGGRIGGAIAPILTAWLLADYLDWRWVLILYGTSGVLIAVLFRNVFRETPEEHPRCDDEERDWIRAGETETDPPGPPPFPPLVPLIKSGTMWLMCSLQFGINIGWVFLVTWLPTYLKEVKEVDPKLGGFMSTLVLIMGIVGMLLGGPVADWCRRRFGVRWGRKIPLIFCYTVAFLAYISCLHLESAWAFVATCAIIAFMTDMSVPAIWAYMQDVGGRNTAAVFGWGNMFGNLGAFTTPVLVPIVLEKWDANGDWHEAFLLFSAGYLIALIAAFGINATRRIE